jgi:transmembrane sensor
MNTGMKLEETQRLKRLNEASQWLLRLQSGELSDEQLNAWLQWIDENPDNFAEYERLQRDWKELDALKGESFDENPLPIPTRAGTPHRREVEHARSDHSAISSSWTTRLVLGVAAGAAAIILGLSATTLWPWRGYISHGPQLVSATVTNRAATLPDGSRMILGARSRVNMDFNGATRELILSKGEAYFKVKHDRLHPFVVQAGGVSVTAVGTAFDVRRDQDRVTITVEEGTVEVSSHRTGQKSATWRAEAGYQLTYSTQDRIASIASVNPADALAWRNGELAYIREPLASVVEDINRYAAHRFIINDPAIARLTFTGTAFASSLDDWLIGIEQAYSISVTRTESGDIILSKEK